MASSKLPVAVHIRTKKMCSTQHNSSFKNISLLPTKILLKKFLFRSEESWSLVALRRVAVEFISALKIVKSCQVSNIFSVVSFVVSTFSYIIKMQLQCYINHPNRLNRFKPIICNRKCFGSHPAKTLIMNMNPR